MNNDLPFRSIMKTADYPNSKSFRIACDCYDPDHDVFMEVSVDSDTKDLSLEFYVQTQTPFWEKSFNRFKIAWKVLTKGYHEGQHHLILNKEGALNLARTLTISVNQLEREKNE